MRDAFKGVSRCLAYPAERALGLASNSVITPNEGIEALSRFSVGRCYVARLCGILLEVYS